MAKFPALPLFTDAYMADTRHLTTMQHGAYLLMLMTAWRMPDCSLPDDDVFLARIAGLSMRTWRANRDTLLSFWKLSSEGRWTQPRLEKEYKYVAHLRNKNVQAANVRWLKDKDTDHATAMPNACQIDAPIPIPKVKDQKENLVKEKVLVDTAPNGFENFWQVYPRTRRGRKDNAMRAYQQAMDRGATAEEIQIGLTAYIISDEVARGFAKGAAAWLNDDRWTVDYKALKSNNNQPVQEPKKGVITL